MSGLARRLVEAVQHSLLGALLVRLCWPLSMIFLVDSQLKPHNPAFFASALFGAVIMTILAWLIGILAIYQKPRARMALERVADAPANAFGVWSQRPAGGLRPPQVTRSLVMILGRPNSQKAVWIGRLASALAAVAFVALMAASCSNGALLVRISPSLAKDPSIRVGLICCVGILAAAVSVRDWAVNCRKLLITDGKAKESP